MNRQTVFDPLRKKEVALTPEERVRQWFIGVLAKDLGVPMHMMMSEVSFFLAGKPYRADIMVYGRNQEPIAIVECKRPEVPVDGNVVNQVARYNLALGLKCIFLTNGKSTLILLRNPDGKYAPATDIPCYDELKGR